MPAPSIQDLDRCPHGRHRGDTCAGHYGGGVFERGCHGGFSLGNPWPHTGGGARIGTTYSGTPILDTDLPKEGRPGWVRARFHADIDDPRPAAFPPPGPWWCTGYGEDYATVTAWLRPGDEVTTWWPEADEIDYEQHDAIVFTDRFPPPDWWTGCGVGEPNGGQPR